MKKRLFLGVCLVVLGWQPVRAQAHEPEIGGLPEDYTHLGVFIKQEGKPSKLRSFKRQQVAANPYSSAYLALLDSLQTQGYQVLTVGGEGSYWGMVVGKLKETSRER